MQMESVASAIGRTLLQHCNQKSVQMPCLASCLALRDKNPDLALRALVCLPPHQFNIIKQLANAYERSFARELMEKAAVMEEARRQEERASKIYKQREEAKDCFALQNQTNKFSDQSTSIMSLVSEAASEPRNKENKVRTNS